MRTEDREESGKEIDNEESMWARTIENDRRSSLAQSRYLFNRFRVDGDKLNPGTDGWRPTLVYRSVDTLFAEAECEHRRWMAFTLVENFGCIRTENDAIRKVYDENEIIQADGGGRKVKAKPRKVARVNRDLKPFKFLDDGSRRKDLHFVAAHEWIKFSPDKYR